MCGLARRSGLSSCRCVICLLGGVILCIRRSIGIDEMHYPVPLAMQLEGDTEKVRLHLLFRPLAYELYARNVEGHLVIQGGCGIGLR
eukprot:6291650-Prorocentrum_lima.AAC.1